MKKFKVNLINKRGDRGTTSLRFGKRVSKTMPTVAALGDLDELQAVLGLARYFTKKKDVKDHLLKIQYDLFKVGTELSSEKIITPLITDLFIQEFEAQVKKVHDQVNIPRSFIIPGNQAGASYINLARTVARRFERTLVGLSQTRRLKNKNILVWINRLSVYLYVLMHAEDRNPKLFS